MWTLKQLRWTSVVVATLCLGTAALAQERRADRDAAADVSAGLVGDYFESRAAGIAIRRPADAKEIRRTGIPEHIVEFANDKKGWLVKLSMTELKTPKPLDVYDDDGRRRDGLVQDTVAGMKSANPGAAVLREEVTKVGEYEVGLVAFRYGQITRDGTARRLMQEALIPVPPLAPLKQEGKPANKDEASSKHPKYYYILTMTSPGAKLEDAGQVDPKEKEAADAFAAMVESVKLLDRGSIREDKLQRLGRTNELLPSLQDKGRLVKVLVPQQYFRLVKDNKDIGYTAVTEESSRMDGHEGVLISVRSHTNPLENASVDVVSRFFIAFNWRHETWTHSVTSSSGKNSQSSAEFGIADSSTAIVVDDEKLRDPTYVVDPKHLPMKQVEQYRLEVRSQVGKVVNRPFVMEQLPRWYLPQAAGRLLPRMLPLKEPKTYAFLSFVSETQELVMRYVDVEAPRPVVLGGRKVTATPVKDRVGYEGVPTTYFISDDGQYLGSEAVYEVDGTRSVVQAIPTDEATLRKLWPGAQLKKPAESEMPEAPRRGGVGASGERANQPR